MDLKCVFSKLCLNQRIKSQIRLSIGNIPPFSLGGGVHSYFKAISSEKGLILFLIQMCILKCVPLAVLSLLNLEHFGNFLGALFLVEISSS